MIKRTLLTTLIVVAISGAAFANNFERDEYGRLISCTEYYPIEWDYYGNVTHWHRDSCVLVQQYQQPYTRNYGGYRGGYYTHQSYYPQSFQPHYQRDPNYEIGRAIGNFIRGMSPHPHY